MIQLYLQTVFITIFYLVATCIILVVAGTSWIDLKELKLKKAIGKLPKNTKHNLITVILLTENHADTVSASLNSITKNGYRNLKLIVVDNASTDLTLKTLRSLLKQRPNINATLVAKRKRSSAHAALTQAFMKVKRGSLLVVTNGAIELRAGALADFNKAALVSNIKHYNVESSVHFSQNYYSFVKILWSLSTEKLAAVLNCFVPFYSSPQKSFACRHDEFNEKVFSYRTNTNAGTKMRLITSWSMFILTSAYFTYISLAFQKNELLMYSFLMFVLWFGFVVTSSGLLQLRQKLSLLSVLPMAYLLFIAVPIASFIYSMTPNRFTRTD